MGAYLNKHHSGAIIGFAALVVVALFVWEGDKGLSLADEGYLWYGSQRTLRGEFPLKDFKSYDPGRYYWSAIFMWMLRDDGVISLRASIAVLQTLALCSALLLIAASVRRKSEKESFFFICICGIIFTAWMFPRHKIYDVSVSIFLVSILSFVIKQPDKLRYFLMGTGVGLVACFGRNHGLYGVVGSLGVIFCLNLRTVRDIPVTVGISCWGAGIIVGYIPIISMVVFVPGFGAALFDSVAFFFRIKATNLPLPIPWPWRVDLLEGSLSMVIRSLFISVLFVLVVLYSIASLTRVIRSTYRDKAVPSAFFAASFLSIPYLHFAYSRAEINHLSQSIFPCLICFLIELQNLSLAKKLAIAALIAMGSMYVTHIYHPGWICHQKNSCVDIKISDNSLQVDSSTAQVIRSLRQLAYMYASDQKQFLVAPFWPGAYALLGRKSPTWDIYALFPNPEDLEEAEIERIRIAAPGFVVIVDSAIDGREELRFRNLHPLIYRYVSEHYVLQKDVPHLSEVFLPK